MSDTLTVPETAKALGIPEWRVYRMISANQLKRTRVGKSFAIPRAEVERHAAELRREAAEGLEAFGVLSEIAEHAREHWKVRIAAAQDALDITCAEVIERHRVLKEGQQPGGAISRQDADFYTRALGQLEEALEHLKVLDQMVTVIADLDNDAIRQAAAVRDTAAQALTLKRTAKESDADRD